MSKDSLRECPFCGSENVEYKHGCGASYVTCNDCESYGPMIRTNNEIGNKDKAIESWNGRAN